MDDIIIMKECFVNICKSFLWWEYNNLPWSTLSSSPKSIHPSYQNKEHTITPEHLRLQHTAQPQTLKKPAHPDFPYTNSKYEIKKKPESSSPIDDV